MIFAANIQQMLLLGDDTQTVVDNSGYIGSLDGTGYGSTASETGSDTGMPYTELNVTSDTSSDTNIGNDFNGTYTLYHDDSSISLLTELGGSPSPDQTGYTLTHAVSSSQNYTETGDNESGAFTRNGTESFNTINVQWNDSSLEGSAYNYTETLTQSDSLSVTGNNQTGTITITQTGTRGHDLLDTGSVNYLVDGTVINFGVDVTETSSDNFTLTNVSDTVNVDSTIGEHDLTTYSMTETSDTALGDWTVGEYGVDVTTITGTANSIQGGYSQYELANDNYTLVETGSGYSEHLTGSDGATQYETGNTIAAVYSRTVDGGGAYTLSETGGTLTPTTSSDPYTLTESANTRTGDFSESETGADRYGLLQQWANVASTNGVSTPGHLNFSPFGEAYVDDAPQLPEEIRQKATKIREIYKVLEQLKPQISELRIEVRLLWSQIDGLTRQHTDADPRFDQAEKNDDVATMRKIVEEGRAIQKKVNDLLERVRQPERQLRALELRERELAAEADDLFKQYDAETKAWFAEQKKLIPGQVAEEWKRQQPERDRQDKVIQQQSDEFWAKAKQR